MYGTRRRVPRCVGNRFRSCNACAMPVAPSPLGTLTPMGATLAAGGALFRTWAPQARDVYVVTDAAATAGWTMWNLVPADRLVPLGDGTWAGFVAGLGEAAAYLFWIRGPPGGTEGFKRDPYAREIAIAPKFPNGPCLVRNGASYPWRSGEWRTPPFHDFIIYQLHVGVFWAVDATGNDRRRSYGRFLDVVEKIPYVRDLGFTAIQLLPIQEYDGDFGLGYNGLDYFSPEMTYQVDDPTELARHLAIVNALLAAANRPPLALADLEPGPNQLKCLIDLCHLNGLAVIFDLVYNHAGGGFDDRSIAFYDRRPASGQAWQDDKATLFFGNGEHAGGLVFNYPCDGVREFLIQNARFFLDEYRIDGIRYDQISVATDHPQGDRFCRDLAATVRFHRPQAIQIAEYWNWDRARAVESRDGGLGFDAALGDGLRNSMRDRLREASAGRDGAVRLDRLKDALYPPAAFPAAWRAVQCLEDHDLVRWDHEKRVARLPRIAWLADPLDPRSWYGRSRSRVATTLLLAAAGIPMLFMGEEFLEDNPWHDDVANWSQFLIRWDRLRGDRHVRDFHRFVTDLVHLRRSLPALRAEGVRVPQVHEQDRMIALHRWVEGEGRDVMVVASFNESTLGAYPVDMPWPGAWVEVFNSDFYDHFPNPWVAGNAGAVHAEAAAGRTYPYAARVKIPANGAVIFARQP
jgi:1,4-alpha-glucan branching enzyme